MLYRIGAIGFVFACTSVAWLVLAEVVSHRTHRQDDKLKAEVGQLWGTPQFQRAPLLYWTTEETVVKRTPDGRSTEQTTQRRHLLPIGASRLQVGIHLEHRRKGLLWYSTYRVALDADYTATNTTGRPLDLTFELALLVSRAVYDDFALSIDGDSVAPLPLAEGHLRQQLHLEPGQSRQVRVSYESQGLEEWQYRFGDHVEQASDFELTMNTDFEAIDFPRQSLSPTRKERTAEGWRLTWQYDRLLTGASLGMVMPARLNPGPWVQEVTQAAPISLFLFFFVLFVFAAVKGIDIHPMNFFFIGAAFFSFHLLLAYLVDHLLIHYAFLAAAAVSVFLVISYMRLVVGLRLALVETGLAQFIYLVLFSYTFFFVEYTGLAITILCIATLFAAMQLTGRMDWSALLARPPVPRKSGRGSRSADNLESSGAEAPGSQGDGTEP